jgi:hypothetical protein
MDPKDLYIRHVVNFCVRLDNALRYLFPKFFTETEHYLEVLAKIHKATIAHYDLLSAGAI